LGLLRLIDHACRAVVGLGIIVMVISIAGQVFYRTVLDDFLGWAEEAARFSFVWLVFLGSVTAFRDRRHLGIDFLPEALGPRGRVILDTVICVVTFGLMIVLAIYGYQLTLRTMTQVSPAIQITMGYVYAAIPISAVLISLYAVADIVRNALALRSGDLSRAAIMTEGSIIDAHAEEGGP
jgi:TRAP-type transport system small permease protein